MSVDRHRRPAGPSPLLSAPPPPIPAPPPSSPVPPPPLVAPPVPPVAALMPAATAGSTAPSASPAPGASTGPGAAAAGPVFPIVLKLPTTEKPQPAVARPKGGSPAKPFSLEPVQRTAPTKVAVQSGDEPPPVDTTEAVVQHSPPFLVSMLVHLVLVIVLALITFREEIAGQIQLNAIYADSLGQQLLDDRLQSPESLDMQVDVPALSFDLKPALDPLAAPPLISDTPFDPLQGAARIDAPSIGLALTGREAGMKKALLPAYGGTATTEGAVLAGLVWLKKQQLKDGGWSLLGPYPDGALVENRCAATAMALLAFQGYGVTHQRSGNAPPEFQAAVQKGWDFLLKMQNKDGQFVHDGGHNHRMYAQAQASIAICEIYAMTKDEKFRRPAQLALDYAHKAQSPELGGWRYEPRFDSDTSVTGWFVMALQSGMMAGLEVQSPNLQLINEFLDKVAVENGTQYCYQIGGKPTLTMTAEAILCRQYLGWKHDDPRMRAGIDQLLANRISYDEDPNVYYWYYATQACHHMDGKDWDLWNEKMREAIPAAQLKTGSEKGSWGGSADRWGPHGGRLYVTCMSVFMLESYYRHLPIYKWRIAK